MFKQHILFLESDKERIAYRSVVASENDLKIINSQKKILSEKGVRFYSHLVTTDQATLSSLKRKDSYFEKVIYYDDFTKFTESFN
ncbi:hypothetical protein BU104_12620 [Staphylococcus xylosus]|uniref:Uncharacterized protein n=1 Tax=Staphylococcus xylosus TaxID=1288 RepID=A0AAQ0LX27_STAXY|nr:hypothetical protein [Staphylococcus xylosus]RIM90970.1 hypothetical protein BU104_12620 [Staphylococcus xylosus]